MPSVRDVQVPSDLPALSRVVTAEAVKAYADAGGDQNPLHQDEAFARAAGFPGIIAHGMFTMGHLAACAFEMGGRAGARPPPDRAVPGARVHGRGDRGGRTRESC